MKTILAPVDFSAVTPSVIRAAADLARLTSSRLLLVNVVQPPFVAGDYGVGITNIAEIIASGEAAARRQLDRWRQKLEKKGLSVSVAQHTGSPVQHILEQAKKSRAAYIVMGTHGRSALYDLLAGSTTTGVVRRSTCPVLVVPPPREKVRK